MQGSGVVPASHEARVGGGLVIGRHRRRVAHAGFSARIRRILDANGIPWQTHTWKVGVGGGHDRRIPLQGEDGRHRSGGPIPSMHSTCSPSSKADSCQLRRYTEMVFAGEREAGI